MPYSRLGLHFVGANGFPCAMYRPALKHIERLAKNSWIFSYAQPAITQHFIHALPVKTSHLLTFVLMHARMDTLFKGKTAKRIQKLI